MSQPILQRLALPSALVIAIFAAAGCTQHGHGNSNSPAAGATTAVTTAPTVSMPSSAKPAFLPSNNASTAAASGATSAAPASPASVTSAPANAAPGTFPSKAAGYDMLAVNLADLALSKSHDAGVKSFAQMTKRDHTAAYNKLEKIAQVGTLGVPTGLSAEHQQTVSSLQPKKGTNFDKAYAEAVVQDHQQEVALFQNASTHAQTQPLREYASQTLPALKKHLRLAQQLRTKMHGGK